LQVIFCVFLFFILFAIASLCFIRDYCKKIRLKKIVNFSINDENEIIFFYKNKESFSVTREQGNSPSFYFYKIFGLCFCKINYDKNFWEFRVSGGLVLKLKRCLADLNIIYRVENPLIEEGRWF